jgi:hypothetical protein
MFAGSTEGTNNDLNAETLTASRLKLAGRPPQHLKILVRLRKQRRNRRQVGADGGELPIHLDDPHGGLSAVQSAIHPAVKFLQALPKE